MPFVDDVFPRIVAVDDAVAVVVHLDLLAGVAAGADAVGHPQFADQAHPRQPAARLLDRQLAGLPFPRTVVLQGFQQFDIEQVAGGLVGVFGVQQQVQLGDVAAVIADAQLLDTAGLDIVAIAQ